MQLYQTSCLWRNYWHSLLTILVLFVIIVKLVPTFSFFELALLSSSSNSNHNMNLKVCGIYKFTEHSLYLASLLMELQLHQCRIFASCNRYVIVHCSRSVVCYYATSLHLTKWGMRPPDLGTQQFYFGDIKWPGWISVQSRRIMRGQLLLTLYPLPVWTTADIMQGGK